MSTNFLTRVIRKAFTFILISTLVTILIVTIHASDALALDTSFDVDGRVTLSFTTPGNDVGSGIAIQSDGKIVVVGTSNDGSGDSDFAVARFNVNGSLDTSFDVDGRVTLSFTTPGNDVGSGIALQSDGKIVVVGTSNNGSGNSELAVARFDVDGSLDNSFGVGGLVTTGFSGGDDVGSGIALQSDGKIVVVGTSNNGSGNSELAVARFDVNGSLDNSFGVGGLVTTGFSGGDDVGSGIALQSDGKIVVVGTSNNGSGNSELAVARFDVNGSLDNSFGVGGLVTLSFTAPGDDIGSGIAVQSDGKIVVVGTTDDLSNTWFAVARFTFNGSLDPSFADDGTVISRSKINGDDMGSGNAVQADDRTVVVGSSDDGSGKWRFVVARFSIDASFPDPVSSSGKAITSFTDGDDIGSGIAVQSDGKIVVVGTADDGSGDSDFAVARYNSADLSLTGGGGGGGGGGGCFIATAADG